MPLMRMAVVFHIYYVELSKVLWNYSELSAEIRNSVNQMWKGASCHQRLRIQNCQSAKLSIWPMPTVLNSCFFVQHGTCFRKHPSCTDRRAASIVKVSAAITLLHHSTWRLTPFFVSAQATSGALHITTAKHPAAWKRRQNLRGELCPRLLSTKFCYVFEITD